MLGQLLGTRGISSGRQSQKVCHPLARGLAGRWKPTWEGYRSHGGLKNGASIVGASGRMGGRAAWKFDGSDDYDDVDSTFFWPNGSPVSVIFWTNTPGGTTGGGFGVGASDFGGRFGAHVPYSDNVLYWDYGGFSEGSGRISTSISAYLSTWTHFALVSAGAGGGFQAIYANGVLLNSGSGGAPNIDLTGLKIGVYSSGGTYYHNGLIDDFSIYNRLLPVDQIQAHFRSTARFYDVTLNETRRYWLMGGTASAAQNADVTVGLVALHGVTPQPLLAEPMPSPGVVALHGVSPTVTHNAAVAPGPIILHGVTPSTSKSTGVSVGLLKLTGVPPSTSKSTTVGIGLLEFTGIAPHTAGINADVTVGILHLHGVAIALLKSQTITVGVVQLHGVTPGVPQSPTITIGLLEFHGLALAVPSQVADTGGFLKAQFFATPTLTATIDSTRQRSFS